MFGSGLNNPYLYMNNFSNVASSGIGLGSGSKLALAGRSLLGKFSFTNFLNGASKTLNVVNQAIPIFYQVKPMVSNAKTMFNIMGALKDDNKPKKNKTITNNYNRNNNFKPNTNTNIKENNNNDYTYNEENPTFFI